MKRLLLFAFPLPVLLMFPAAFVIHGLWVPALAWSLGAAVYLAIIWHWQRVREADEALARAAVHDAAEAEEMQKHKQTARDRGEHGADDMRGGEDRARANNSPSAESPPTASAPAQGPPVESFPSRPSP